MLLAYVVLEREEADEAAKKRRQRTDPRYDALMAQAVANQPQDASEFLRQRAAKAKARGGTT